VVAGLAGEGFAEGEEFEDLAITLDGSGRAVAVEVREETGGLKPTESLVPELDFGECFFAGGAEMGFAVALEDEFKAGGHGIARRGGGRGQRVWRADAGTE